MSLIAKLAEVMKAVQRVPKRGHNDFYNYDYATEADVLEAVRMELAERGIMLLPAVSAEHRLPIGEKGTVLTTLELTYTFWDSETNEQIDRPWRGWGCDKEDKAGYKALTGGSKYFIQKTFLLPTGDDPERDDAHRSMVSEPVRTKVKPHQASPSVPAASPAEPDGGNPPPTGDDTAVVIHPVTGEVLPAPPPGFHYVANYLFNDPWHSASILNFDGTGAALKVRTKTPAGKKLKKAQDLTAWARIILEPAKKNQRPGDDRFVENVLFFEASLADIPF